MKIEHTLYGDNIPAKDLFAIIYRIIKEDENVKYTIETCDMAKFYTQLPSLLHRLSFSFTTSTIAARFLCGYWNSYLETKYQVIKRGLRKAHAWSRFLKNIKEYYHLLGSESSEDMLKRIIIQNSESPYIIDWAFDWNKTPEGWDFWRELDEEIANILWEITYEYDGSFNVNAELINEGIRNVKSKRG